MEKNPFAVVQGPFSEKGPLHPGQYPGQFPCCF